MFGLLKSPAEITVAIRQGAPVVSGQPLIADATGRAVRDVDMVGGTVRLMEDVWLTWRRRKDLDESQAISHTRASVSGRSAWLWRRRFPPVISSRGKGSPFR